MNGYDHGRHHRPRNSAEEAAAERRHRAAAGNAYKTYSPSMVMLVLCVAIAVYMVVRLGADGSSLERWLGLIAATVIGTVMAWDVREFYQLRAHDRRREKERLRRGR